MIVQQQQQTFERNTDLIIVQELYKSNFFYKTRTKVVHKNIIQRCN